MLNTFIANLAHAVRNGETVHIGGGEFSPGELRKVCAAITALQNPAKPKPREYAGVRHTACKFCGLDIEGHAPYRRGEWLDRGANRKCPNTETFHAPVRSI